MHKRRWNALKLDLRIEPRAPLLIKSGLASPNPSLPDMQFVRTMTPEGETVFIPGSSLKGTFRSFTEKVLRTVKANGACEPFPSSPDYCGRRLGGEEDPARIYQQSCRACKIYGNTRLRGRLSFTDAFPEGAVKTETRYGVAISRLTNAVVPGALYETEVLVQGRFLTSLVLENFEVWQVGLLALTLQAINDGLVKLGFGKNRGFGEVSMTVEQAIVEMAKHPDLPRNALWGVGAFVEESERSRYGLQPNDRLEELPEGTEADLAVFLRRTYTQEAWKQIAEKAIASIAQTLEAA
ncbi:MAG: RAMP superfamily CRISPR-associated protein [Armatimonadota bacterium]|nr:RAMP superfamily CRISPR-associated protein [Armatimonadota bacterium]MDR7614895.1 RAMP superfamily CRISPR-associated protein [Armatimonadota bacterium]